MRILNYEISKKGVVNLIKEDKRNALKQIKRTNNIREKIYRTALARSRAGVQEWKNATTSAESLILPNNTELIRIYRDVEVDLHLFALMQTIRLKVIANNFFIYNQDGAVNDEATALFKKKWFRKTAKYIVDSEFYGFSLIQFLDVKDGIFSDAEIVPREYVIQQKRGVKKSLANSTDLVPFDAPEFLNWVVAVGEIDNLGLLHKATPLVIKKKEVISAWSEGAEIFGMPLRVGRTNIGDPVKRANMEDMLENIGSAGWAVIHEDDVVEFVETSKTDFFKIYKEFIDTVNSELSKGFLLQTGTTDEKAFSGSAGVHENLLKSLIEAYIVLVEETTNEAIIPACVRLGLLPVGCYFKSDNEQKISLEDMVKIVTELLKYKDIPSGFIFDTFGVPVEDKELEEIADPKASPSSVMQSVKNMYSNVLKTCEH
jgi:phage gp29-like protein